MADLSTLCHSPLAELAGDIRAGTVEGARDVRLVESPFLTMVSVRVDPASPAAYAIEGALGARLPRRVGEVTGHGSHQVLWLGPDEWLVVSTTAGDVLVEALAAAVAGRHAAVVDVSANRTVLELSGAAARAVLEKGCPVDLHPREFSQGKREFSQGKAVTTTLARVPLLLWHAGPDSYRLLPRSSFAQYVARWLLDAMQEFASDFADGGSS
jgi:sarcosine oxidase subunit gamma